MPQPMFSVVVPLRDRAEFIRQTIESVTTQTFADVEVIVVDDASSDGGPDIVAEIAAIDSRVSLTRLTHNVGTHTARLHGLKASTGQHVLFLDADDYFEPDALATLARILPRIGADIVHFGTYVHGDTQHAASRIQALERSLVPRDVKLRGSEILEACFVTRQHLHTLWNKVYARSVVDRALAVMEDAYLPKSQDVYEYFVLASCATSFVGLPDVTLYNYRFGVGVTGREHITLSSFDRFCTSSDVARITETYAATVGSEAIVAAAASVRKILLHDTVSTWLRYVNEVDAPVAFDTMVRHWGVTEVTAHLYERFYDVREQVARRLSGLSTLWTARSATISTIAVFYYRYAAGGIQRVISQQIPVLLKLGYDVILYTDEPPTDGDYALPESVRRVVLPTSLGKPRVEYRARIEEFAESLQSEKVDAVVYHAASAPFLLQDLLVLAHLGIHTVVSIHEMAFASLIGGKLEAATRRYALHLADRVHVLSRNEEAIWRSLGVNAVYMPNPIADAVIRASDSECDPYRILWFGRLSDRDKVFLDAIEVFRRVILAIPQAELDIVGPAFSPGSEERLRSRIARYGLEDSVRVHGYLPDVAPFLERATIHLLTSSSESFPLSIVEAKSHGLPTVLYDLPHVEMVREGRGLVTVPFGDVARLAEEAISILQNPELRAALSAEATASLASHAVRSDQMELWYSALTQLLEPGPRVAFGHNEELRIALTNIMTMYGVGDGYAQRTLAQLRRDLRKAQAARKSIEDSVSYRLARLITRPLRAAKKLLAKLRG